MTEPVLDQLNLIVRDMERSIDFYRAIGLAIPEDTVWRTATGAHHVEIKAANGFELALDSQPLAAVYNAGWREFKGEGDRAVMSFRLPNAEEVDAVYDRVVALGHGSAQPPLLHVLGLSLRHRRRSRWQPCRTDEPARPGAPRRRSANLGMLDQSWRRCEHAPLCTIALPLV